MAGGSCTVLQPEPLLPVEAATKMPDAWAASVVARKVSGAQVSFCGQPQLLFKMWGRSAGLGLLPARSVGAVKNWKQPMYVLGRPSPRSILRQPTHLAPGATPI